LADGGSVLAGAAYWYVAGLACLLVRHLE